MTAVPDSERRTRYAPVVATTSFAVGFTLYEEDSVSVFIDGIERATGDATYAWSLIATFTDGECASATILAAGVGWTGVTVDIVGKIKPSRADQFADGAGIPASDQNLILNRIVAALREIYDWRTRVIALPFGETAAAGHLLASAAARANMALTFDASGNPALDDLVGDKGWSPVFAVVSDSLRRVLQVTDWQGGEGTKPATGLYVGATGLVSSVASGADIRGAQGASGAGTGDMVAAQNLNDVANKATSRTNLGVAIGTDVQAFNAIIAALAGLTGAANKLAYFTGASAMAVNDFTAAGRSMVGAADAAAQTALLSAVVGDGGSGGTKGLVPAPGAGDAAGGKFLKADGTFAVPSGAAAATQSEMEAASSNTVFATPGRLQYHPGPAKCWAQVSVSAGTPTLQQSHNITSITDNGVGRLIITIATDFSSVSWAASIASVAVTAQDRFIGLEAQFAGSVQMYHWDITGADYADPATWCFAGFGDQ